MTRHNQKDLERELLRRYSEGAKLGYRATRFYQLFTRGCKHYKGGIKAVQGVLRRGRKKPTAGFEFVTKKGRLDLALETLVLDPDWTHLFTDEDRDNARYILDRLYPDELPQSRNYWEGVIKRVQVNRYERDPIARQACKARHGTRCKVCNLKFEERYGDIGLDFIHVHHLIPLAKMRKGYHVNPDTDLLPVCPNCHAMLHQSDPPFSIDELKAKLNL